MWDWGAQPFNTVITTFVFAVYITSSSFGDTDSTSRSLSASTAVAGLIIACVAPVLGQNADRRGHAVRHLRWLTWALALISAALFFVAPQQRFLWLGLGLLGLGSIVSEIAGVNYNSLLNRVAVESNVGKVSGFGWGMGYMGGIIVLVAIYFLLVQPQTLIFGIPNTDSIGIRIAMLVCGVWTMLFTIPTFRVLRDQPRPAQLEAPKTTVSEAYATLFRTIGRLWRQQRQTAYFLLASALFRDGLAGVFAFGAVIAAGTFGFAPGDVVVFGVAANVIAGLTTMAVGLLDDRVGPKTVIMASLIVLVLSGGLIFFLHDGGKPVFWVFGLLMSACVGPAQSASRSFLARLVPAGHDGEIFGLYATTGRVVSFLSPAAFGLMITIGTMVQSTDSAQHWGILGIVAVLAAGLIVMLPVRPASEQTAIETEPPGAALAPAL
ncbi:MAG: MFS transporter [Propionibacteriaceae bacterium]|nr:MFS transporter [Propionibacteriaceae bacterium]